MRVPAVARNERTAGDVFVGSTNDRPGMVGWKEFYGYGKDMSDKTLLFVVFVISTIALIYIEYFTDGF
jgi:hypothetical protein